MILLVGKSCSGKSTLLAFLERMGNKKVVSFTTRPPRDGETQGRDYYFIDDRTFAQMEARDMFFETTSYNVADGSTWKYGTTKESYTDNSILIVNPSGLKKIKEEFGSKALSFLITCSNQTILDRQKIRGDDKDEAFRRFIADMEDFSNIEKYIDFSLNSDLLSPDQLAVLIDDIVKEVHCNV